MSVENYNFESDIDFMAQVGSENDMKVLLIIEANFHQLWQHYRNFLLKEELTHIAISS